MNSAITWIVLIFSKRLRDFINDIQKWAFVDGQFNVMPTLNNIPLKRRKTTR